MSRGRFVSGKVRWARSIAAAGDFDESKHPRDERGRFGDGGSPVGAIEEPKTYAEAKALVQGRARSGKLTADQVMATEFYSGSEFVDVNRELRGLDTIAPLGRSLDTSTWTMKQKEFADGVSTRGELNAKIVRELDGAIASSELTGPVVAFRGAAMPGTRDIESGDVVEDPAFTSTSALRKVAERFVRSSKLSRDPADVALFQVTIPKGAHALPVYRKSEVELVLGRGTQFHVTAVDRSGKVPVIDAEVRP